MNNASTRFRDISYAIGVWLSSLRKRSQNHMPRDPPSTRNDDLGDSAANGRRERAW